LTTLQGDVSSLYQITDDYSEMCITPKNADELIELLQRRHAILKEERTAKRHGEFKIKDNKAGNSSFVAHEDARLLVLKLKQVK